VRQANCWVLYLFLRDERDFATMSFSYLVWHPNQNKDLGTVPPLT